MRKNIQVIYEDQDLAVCHKAAGIPVQTSRAGQQDLVSLLRNYYAERGENTRVYVVHRLDQPVEGLMVFARNKQAAADLSSQSREKRMNKCYMALAEGRFQDSSGILENDLLRDGKSNTSRVVPQGTPGAKRAKLFYEVIEVWQRNQALTEEPDSGLSGMQQQGRRIFSAYWKMQRENDVSLLEIKLETGRHHQIRVQMAYAGHPLAGDKKYNPNCLCGYLPVALCSVKLAFSHPKDGRTMEFDLRNSV
ncbi:MAG: RluA family pseudouridine synthase [Lachnospiraceae bacterium]|nr:RluA family pseudouridine synthase [Lachnospiraceae bacterium]